MSLFFLNGGLGRECFFVILQIGSITSSSRTSMISTLTDWCLILCKICPLEIDNQLKMISLWLWQLLVRLPMGQSTHINIPLLWKRFSDISLLYYNGLFALFMHASFPVLAHILLPLLHLPFPTFPRFHPFLPLISGPHDASGLSLPACHIKITCCRIQAPVADSSRLFSGLCLFACMSMYVCVF